MPKTKTIILRAKDVVTRFKASIPRTKVIKFTEKPSLRRLLCLKIKRQ